MIKYNCEIYTLVLMWEKMFLHDTVLFLNGLLERNPFTPSDTSLSNSVLLDTLMEEGTYKNMLEG